MWKLYLTPTYPDERCNKLYEQKYLSIVWVHGYEYRNGSQVWLNSTVGA